MNTQVSVFQPPALKRQNAMNVMPTAAMWEKELLYVYNPLTGTVTTKHFSVVPTEFLDHIKASDEWPTPTAKVDMHEGGMHWTHMPYPFPPVSAQQREARALLEAQRVGA